MTVLMFQERFAAPILAGTKKQTIRPPRKRPISVGDKLSLRQWAGTAYRSGQVEIKAVTITAVFGIELRLDGYRIGIDEILRNRVSTRDEFARADGFADWAEMMAYLNAPGGYGLPFTGLLYQWGDS